MQYLRRATNKRGGVMTFTDEQQTTLIEFLEAQNEAGLTLQEVIDGLTNGILLTPGTSESNASLTE